MIPLRAAERSTSGRSPAGPWIMPARRVWSLLGDLTVRSAG